MQAEKLHDINYGRKTQYVYITECHVITKKIRNNNLQIVTLLLLPLQQLIIIITISTVS